MFDRVVLKQLLEAESAVRLCFLRFTGADHERVKEVAVAFMTGVVSCVAALDCVAKATGRSSDAAARMVERAAILLMAPIFITILLVRSWATRCVKSKVSFSATFYRAQARRVVNELRCGLYVSISYPRGVP